MEHKHIFGFVGASGSGKSTILNYISQKYDILCQEISPRCFFDENNGSYDQQNTNEIQSKIVLHNVDSTHRMIEKSILENKNIALTRTPLDVYGYCKALNKASYMQDWLENTIDYLSNLENYVFLYFPLGFSLKNSSDILRGNNEEIRQKTDKEIFNVLWWKRIKYRAVYGQGVRRRMERMDEIMKEFGVLPKMQ